MEESNLADDVPMMVIIGTTLSPVSQVIMKAVPVIGPAHEQRAPRVESVITLPPAKASQLTNRTATFSSLNQTTPSSLNQTTPSSLNQTTQSSLTQQTTSSQITSQPSNPIQSPGPLLNSPLLPTQPVIVKSKGSITVQHYSRGGVGVIRSLKAEQNKEYKSEWDTENSNDSCSFVTNGSDNSMDSVTLVQGEKMDSWVTASGARSEESPASKDFKGGEDSPSSNCSSFR